MFCPKCNKNIDKDSNFCIFCGNKIEKDLTQSKKDIEKEINNKPTIDYDKKENTLKSAPSLELLNEDHCPNCGKKMTKGECPNCNKEFDKYFER